jgi:hypothetical protein
MVCRASWVFPPNLAEFLLWPPGAVLQDASASLSPWVLQVRSSPIAWTGRIHRDSRDEDRDRQPLGADDLQLERPELRTGDGVFLVMVTMKTSCNGPKSRPTIGTFYGPWSLTPTPSEGPSTGIPSLARRVSPSRTFLKETGGLLWCRAPSPLLGEEPPPSIDGQGRV